MQFESYWFGLHYVIYKSIEGFILTIDERIEVLSLSYIDTFGELTILLMRAGFLWYIDQLEVNIE